MKNKLTDPIAFMIKASLPTVILVVFFLLAGISAGACTEVFMGSAHKEELVSFLGHNWGQAPSGKDLPYVFLSSGVQNLGLLLIIALSGLTAVGFPLALLAVAYKGASLGFASALLMDALGVKGALLSILSLVPANLLLLPPLLIAGVSAVNLGITVIFSRPGSAKNCLRESAGNYIAFQLILSVFLLAGCLVESFICPFLQQLLI